MEYLLIIAICVLLGVIGIVIVFLRPQSNPKKDVKMALLESEKRQQVALYEFQKEMQQQLRSFQREMNLEMKQDLHTLNEATTHRLFSMEKQMSEHLQKGVESTSSTFEKVMEQMGKLDESQKNLKELSFSISSIQKVLTDKKTRGIYGEVELYSLLEMAFGIDQHFYAKQYKLSNQSIVDAVVFAKHPLKMICIDAKFPLENYNRMIEASTKEEKRRYHQAFLLDVKKHIKTIAEKYILPQETAEFAYMFLPAEAIFSYLYSSCEEVISLSYEKKVYIVSPTTLMAYITAIKAIYLGIERNDNMINIQQELKKLQVEFERFEKRSNAIANDFEKSYQDMKLLNITAKKMIQRFQDIADVKLDEK